jgi:hypothetical protein
MKRATDKITASFMEQFAGAEGSGELSEDNAAALDGIVKIKKTHALPAAEAAELKKDLQDGKLSNIGQVTKENFARLAGTGLATDDMVVLTMKDYHMKYEGFGEEKDQKKVSPFLRMESEKLVGKIAKSLTIQELAMYRHKTNELLLKIGSFDALRTVKYLRDGGLFKDILVGHRDTCDKLIRAAGGWKLAIDIARDVCDFESNTNFYPDHVRMQILEFYRNTLVLRLGEAKQINEDYANGHDRVDELVDKAHYRAEEAEHKALHATRLQHASEAKMQYLQERVKHLEDFVREHPDVHESSVPQSGKAPEVDDTPVPEFKMVEGIEKKKTAKELAAETLAEKKATRDKEAAAALAVAAAEVEKAEKADEAAKDAEFASGFDVATMDAEQNLEDAAAAEEVPIIAKFSPVNRSRPASRGDALSSENAAADEEGGGEDGLAQSAQIVGERISTPNVPVVANVRESVPGAVPPAVAAALSSTAGQQITEMAHFAVQAGVEGADAGTQVSRTATPLAPVMAARPMEDSATQMSRPSSTANVVPGTVGAPGTPEQGMLAVQLSDGSTQWSRPVSALQDIPEALQLQLADGSTQWSRPSSSQQPIQMQMQQPVHQHTEQPMQIQIQMQQPQRSEEEKAVEKAAEKAAMKTELQAQMAAQMAQMAAQLEAQQAAMEVQAESVSGRPTSSVDKERLRAELEAQVKGQLQEQIHAQMEVQLSQETAAQMADVQAQHEAQLAQQAAFMQAQLAHEMSEKQMQLAEQARALQAQQAKMGSIEVTLEMTQAHEAAMAAHEADMAAHEAQVASHETQMAAQMANMQASMAQQQHELAATMAAEQERKLHELQMIQHEAQMEQHEAQMAAEVQGMEAHEAQMAAHEAQMAAHEQKMADEVNAKEAEMARLRGVQAAKMAALEAERKCAEEAGGPSEESEKARKAAEAVEKAAYDKMMSEMQAAMEAERAVMEDRLRVQAEQQAILREEMEARQEAAQRQANEAARLVAELAEQARVQQALEVRQEVQQQAAEMAVQKQQNQVNLMQAHVAEMQQVQQMQMQLGGSSDVGDEVAVTAAVVMPVAVTGGAPLVTTKARWPPGQTSAQQPQQQALKKQQQQNQRQFRGNSILQLPSPLMAPTGRPGSGSNPVQKQWQRQQLSPDRSPNRTPMDAIMIPSPNVPAPFGGAPSTGQLSAMSALSGITGISGISALSSGGTSNYPSAQVSSNGSPLGSTASTAQQRLEGQLQQQRQEGLSVGLPESVPNYAAVNQMKLSALYLGVEKQQANREDKDKALSNYQPPMSGNGWVVVEPVDEEFPRSNPQTPFTPATPAPRTIAPATPMGNLATSEELVGIAQMDLSGFQQPDTSPSNVERFTHEGPMYDIDPAAGKPRTAPVSVRIFPAHAQKELGPLSEIEERQQQSRETPASFFHDSSFTDYLFAPTSLGIVGAGDDKEVADEGTQTEVVAEGECGGDGNGDGYGHEEGKVKGHSQNQDKSKGGLTTAQLELQAQLKAKAHGSPPPTPGTKNMINTLSKVDRQKVDGSGIQLVRVVRGEFEVCPGIFYAHNVMHDMSKGGYKLPHNTILCRREEDSVARGGIRDVPKWMPLPPLPEEVDAFIVPQLMRLSPGLSWVTKPSMAQGLRLPHDILVVVLDGDVVLPVGLEFVKMSDEFVLDGRIKLPLHIKLMRPDEGKVDLSVGTVLPGGCKVLALHDYFDLPSLPNNSFLADCRANAELPYGFSAVQTTLQLDKEEVTRKELCAGVVIVRKPEGIRLRPGQEIIRRPAGIHLPHGMSPSTKSEVSLELLAWLDVNDCESVQLEARYDFLPGTTIARGISIVARPYGLTLPPHVYLIRRDSNANLPQGFIATNMPYLPAGMVLPRNVHAIKMLPNAHIPTGADLSGLKGVVLPNGNKHDGIMVLAPEQFGIRPGQAVIQYTFKGNLPVLYERVPRVDLPDELRLPQNTTVVQLVPRYELPHGVQVETCAALGRGVQLGPGTLLGRGTRVLPRPPGLVLEPGHELVHIDKGAHGGLLPLGITRIDPPPVKHSVWLAPDVICIQLPKSLALPSARELGSMLNVTATATAERSIELPENVVLLSRSRAHYDIHHAANERAPLPAGFEEIPPDALPEEEAAKIPFGSFPVQVEGRFEYPVGCELLPGMVVLRRPVNMHLPSGVEYVSLGGGCLPSPDMELAHPRCFNFVPKPGSTLVRVPRGLQPFSWGRGGARGVESVLKGGGLLLPDFCFLVDRPLLKDLPGGLRDFLKSNPEASRALPRNMPPMLEVVELVPQYELPESMGLGARGCLRRGIHLMPGQRLADGITVGVRPAGALPPAGMELLLFNRAEPRFASAERRIMALRKLGLSLLNTDELGDPAKLGDGSFFDTPAGCAWVRVDKFSLGAIARLTRARDLGNKQRQDVTRGVCTPILTLPSLHGKEVLELNGRPTTEAVGVRPGTGGGGGGGGSSLADQEMISNLLVKVDELETELSHGLEERDTAREEVRRLNADAKKRVEEFRDKEALADGAAQAEEEARITIWGLKAQVTKAEARAKLKLTDYVKEKTKNKWTASTQKGKIAGLQRQLKQWKEINGAEEKEGDGGGASDKVSQERLMEVSLESKYAEASKYRAIIHQTTASIQTVLDELLVIQNTASIPDRRTGYDTGPSSVTGTITSASMGVDTGGDAVSSDVDVGSVSQTYSTEAPHAPAPGSMGRQESLFTPLLRAAYGSNTAEAAGTARGRLKIAHETLLGALQSAEETDKEATITELSAAVSSSEALTEASSGRERFDSGIPLSQWTSTALGSILDNTKAVATRSHRALTLAEVEVTAQQEQRRKLVALCQRSLTTLKEYKTASVHQTPDRVAPLLEQLASSKEELMHWKTRADVSSVATLGNLGVKYQDLREVEQMCRIKALALRTQAKKDEQRVTLARDVDPKEVAAVHHLSAARELRARTFDDRAEVVRAESDALVGVIHKELNQLELNVRDQLPSGLLAKVLRTEEAVATSALPLPGPGHVPSAAMVGAGGGTPLLRLTPQKASLALGSRAPPAPGSPMGKSAWTQPSQPSAAQLREQQMEDASIASATRALSPPGSMSGGRPRLRPLRSGVASGELLLDIRVAKEQGRGDGIYSAGGNSSVGGGMTLDDMSLDSSSSYYGGGGGGGGGGEYRSRSPIDDNISIGGDSMSSMGTLGTFASYASAGPVMHVRAPGRSPTGRTLRSTIADNDDGFVSFSASMGLSSHKSPTSRKK